MDPRTNLPPQETYTLPDSPTAVPTFVNELTRKGYTVVQLTATHVVVQPPPKQSSKEAAGGKKQILLETKPPEAETKTP